MKNKERRLHTHQICVLPNNEPYINCKDDNCFFLLDHTLVLSSESARKEDYKSFQRITT